MGRGGSAFGAGRHGPLRLCAYRGCQRGHSEVSSQSRKGLQRYTPSPAEWASLTIQPVTERGFRAEHVTEGKIAIDEDRSTPVFSPYAGRVTKLLAKPGDSVVKGQPLFVIEAADNVQAQNDFIGAMAAMNKAKSALDLAQLQGTRAKDLFEGKAVPLKDYQQSQATLIQAENDMRSSQTAMEAARNKLRILGLSDEDIATFQEKRMHQSRDHHLRADRRHRGPAQDRPGPVCQRRRQRPRLRDRRSLHRLDDRFRPRERLRQRRDRAGGDVQRAGAAGPSVVGAAQLRRHRDRSGDAAAAGPRHDRQQGRHAEAGNVRQRHDLFGGRPSGGRRAEAGTDLRGRPGADLGRA